MMVLKKYILVIEGELFLNISHQEYEFKTNETIIFDRIVNMLTKILEQKRLKISS